MRGCSQLLRTTEAAIISSSEMMIAAVAAQATRRAARPGPAGATAGTGVGLGPTSWLLPILPLIVVIALRVCVPAANGGRAHSGHAAVSPNDRG